MATSTDRVIFPEGSLVKFDSNLCSVEEVIEDVSIIYRVKSLDTGTLYFALAHQLDSAAEEEETLNEEFSQEFDQEELSNRFSEVTEDAKKRFMDNQKNDNTTKKTNQMHKLVTNYLKFIKEKNPLHKIEPDRLNKILEDFLVCLKKGNGKDYEPSSIRSIISGINRHLQEHKYPKQLMGSVEFSGMRDILTSKFKVSVCYDRRYVSIDFL
jgi:hypothetical protein